MGGHRASGAGDDLVDGPVDLAAVRADDALLDAIAGGRADSAVHGADYGFESGSAADDEADDERLAAILTAWRADIEAEPMPELVGLDEAVEAVAAGHEAHDRVRSRARRRMPFAIAAAAAVVAVAGMTVAVHGSKPGDTLFGVSKVFFSEHAAQVEQVEDVRRNIDLANDAIARGDREGARRALTAANLGLPALPPPDREPLQVRRDEVQGSLAPKPPAAPSSRSTGRPQAGTSEQQSRDPKPNPGSDPQADRDDPRGVPSQPDRGSDPADPSDPSDSTDPSDPSATDPGTNDPGTTDTREVPVQPQPQPPPVSPRDTTTTPVPPPN